MQSNQKLHNVPEFTVSEVSHALKNLVEENFAYVRVKGELSGVKFAGSGHMYGVLKDDKSVIDAVCWRGNVSKLTTRPEDGLEVVCIGRLTTYPGRSKYQIIIESMELAGQGALLKMIEERKKKLAAEGLFDQNRKKQLPFLPRHIAVITSPTGAVIRDILHRISDRFPTHVQLFPVQVQGDEAAQQITNAFRMIESLQHQDDLPVPDLVILARGGGSIEDLMAFQEEEVVRAVADCKIPIISAIGHETDISLTDFAADYRAPTPTGAAEKAVPQRQDLIYQISEYDHRLKQASLRLLEQKSNEMLQLARLLPKPHMLIEELTQKLDDRVERFSLAVKSYFDTQQYKLQSLEITWSNLKNYIAQLDTSLMQNAYALQQNLLSILNRKEQAVLPLVIYPERLLRVVEQSEQQISVTMTMLSNYMKQAYTSSEQKLESLSKLLESYSYQKILHRGFALIQDEQTGKTIHSVSMLDKPKPISIHLKDGKVKGDFSSQKKTSPSKKKTDQDQQPKLF